MEQLEVLSLRCGEPSAIKWLERNHKLDGLDPGHGAQEMGLLKHLCHPSVWRGEVTREPTSVSRDTLEIRSLGWNFHRGCLETCLMASKGICGFSLNQGLPKGHMSEG